MKFIETLMLTLIGISLENKKIAHLYLHLEASHIRLNELGSVSIFTSKKVWKFLIKIQSKKSDPNKD